MWNVEYQNVVLVKTKIDSIEVGGWSLRMIQQLVQSEPFGRSWLVYSLWYQVDDFPFKVSWFRNPDWSWIPFSHLYGYVENIKILVLMDQSLKILEFDYAIQFVKFQLFYKKNFLDNIMVSKFF